MTTVGASDTIIRTLVSVPISAFPYCKVLIAKLVIRQILSYNDSPSISMSDLVSTVASYFDMSTAIAEREVAAAAISIRDSICCIDNMSGVSFLDSNGKSVTVADPDNRPRDVS